MIFEKRAGYDHI